MPRLLAKRAIAYLSSSRYDRNLQLLTSAVRSLTAGAGADQIQEAAPLGDVKGRPFDDGIGEKSQKKARTIVSLGPEQNLHDEFGQ